MCIRDRSIPMIFDMIYFLQYIVNLFLVLIYVMSHSVCDLYDRVPYDLVAFFIAFLKDLDYLTVTRRLIVNVHDCIVKIGVECLTVGFYLFDAELSERFVKACLLYTSR